MSRLINLIVVLTATLDCNQRCPWCIRDKLNKEFNLSLDNMTVETAKAILAKHENPTQIVATGGEPMLNMPLVEYLASTGERVKISTNGSIKLPSMDLVKDSKVVFDISVNSKTPPALYTQLLENDYPRERIRGFVYFNPDNPDMIPVLEMFGKDGIKGYEVLPNMWTPVDPEYERKIIEMAPLFAEVHKTYGKDHGYFQYIESPTSNEPPAAKFKYGPDGSQIRDLWTQGLPEEIAKERAKHIFNDVNVMRYGVKSFQKGIEGFNMPVEYYTALMYEEMKKYLED